ncbi:MAG: hypothetical protein ACI9WL_001341 [Rubritalea sp.]|jgi:hypothetical protein
MLFIQVFITLLDSARRSRSTQLFYCFSSFAATQFVGAKWIKTGKCQNVLSSRIFIAVKTFATVAPTGLV